jgi:hypothetical protein
VACSSSLMIRVPGGRWPHPDDVRNWAGGTRRCAGFHLFRGVGKNLRNEEKALTWLK